MSVFSALIDEKNRVGVMGVFIMFISYVVYSSVLPVFPIQARTCGMDGFQVGIVVGIFPVGMVISSLFIGRILPTLGPKNVFVFGFIFAAIAALAFGLVPFVFCGEEGLWAPFLPFIFFRFFQGAAAGVLETTVLYAISVSHSQNLAQVVAYQQTSIGVSLMIGPLFGGFLYTFTGFFYLFVLFCGLDIMCILLVIFFFPEQLSIEEEEDLEDQKLMEEGKKSYNTTKDTNIQEKDYGKQPQYYENENENIEEKSSLSALCPANLCTISLVFACAYLHNSQEAVVPLYLLDEFGWGALLSGVVFSIASLMYATVSIIVGQRIDAMEDKNTKTFKKSFTLGFLLMSVGFYCMGPLPFGFSSPYTIIAGVTIIGAGFGFLLTPTLPDIQLCAELKNGRKIKEHQSFLSSIWIAVFSAATAIGSALVGLMYDQIGFQESMFIFACLSIFSALCSWLYVLFGPEVACEK